MRWLLKRWYVWLAVPLMAGLAVMATLIYLQQDQITQANCDKIKEGMTEEEVEKILGAQEGDHTSWPTVSSLMPTPPPREYWRIEFPEGHGYTVKDWTGEDGCIDVQFIDGKVYHAVFWPDIYEHRAKRL
jgi:hypothetical protein